MPGSQAKFLIMCAIELEYKSISRNIANVEKLVTPSGGIFLTGKLDTKFGSECKIYLQRTFAGNDNSIFETQEGINFLNPDAVVFIGVAGGIQNKVKVGDLVVGTEVIYYESGKSKNGEFKSRPKIFECSRPLVKEADFQAYSSTWQQHCDGDRPNCEVHLGPIASGEKVITSIETPEIERMHQVSDKILALEMEGHGCMKAANALGVPSIVIRGISDLLDNKNSDEGGSDEERQKIASDRASAFGLSVISNLDLKVFEQNQAPPEKKVLITLVLEADLHDTTEIMSKLGKYVFEEGLELVSQSRGSLILRMFGSNDDSMLLSALHKSELLVSIGRKKIKDLITEPKVSSDPDFNSLCNAIEMAANSELHEISQLAVERLVSRRREFSKVNSMFKTLMRGKVRRMKPKPAVPIKDSITENYLICLEDGKKFKSLKRHLKAHYDLTPEQYKKRWNLSEDYPMVAPGYARKRIELAKQMGLGSKKNRN